MHRLGRADGRISAVVVRLLIEAGTQALDLGFSDSVCAFLDGEPLVSLDHSYRFDRPRFQGVMGLHQARLHLPLERGLHELRLVVADSFGGWGLVGQWVDAVDPEP